MRKIIRILYRKMDRCQGARRREQGALDTRSFDPNSWGMEVHFSPEKEARLQQVATRIGKDPAQLIEEAVDRMLARFIEAVEEGRASARRGDLLEHDDVVEHIEQMFRS